MPRLAVLTWLLQVMPLFFVVGGYANARSIEAAQRRGEGWPAYLVARVRRLVRPTAVFMAAWAGIAAVATLLGPAGEAVAAVPAPSPSRSGSSASTWEWSPRPR